MSDDVFFPGFVDPYQNWSEEPPNQNQFGNANSMEPPDPTLRPSFSTNKTDLSISDEAGAIVQHMAEQFRAKASSLKKEVIEEVTNVIMKHMREEVAKVLREVVLKTLDKYVPIAVDNFLQVHNSHLYQVYVLITPGRRQNRLAVLPQDTANNKQ